MQFLCTYTPFRTETEFAAVGKTGESIYIDAGCINLGLKKLRIISIFSNNRFRMAAVICVYVRNGIIDRINDFHGKDIIQKLKTEIFRFGFPNNRLADIRFIAVFGGLF